MYRAAEFNWNVLFEWENQNLVAHNGSTVKTIKVALGIWQTCLLCIAALSIYIFKTKAEYSST